VCRARCSSAVPWGINRRAGSNAVTDVDATAAAVRAAGGKILMERFTIGGVGHLIFFADPAGNPIGAMQYDPDA
jgi:uncharacterized protein